MLVLSKNAENSFIFFMFSKDLTASIFKAALKTSKTNAEICKIKYKVVDDRKIR